MCLAKTLPIQWGYIGGVLIAHDIAVVDDDLVRNKQPGGNNICVMAVVDDDWWWWLGQLCIDYIQKEI